MAACAVNARVVMIGTGRPPAVPPNMNGMYIKNLMLKRDQRGQPDDAGEPAGRHGAEPAQAGGLEGDPVCAPQAYTEIRDGDHIGKIIAKSDLSGGASGLSAPRVTSNDVQAAGRAWPRQSSASIATS